jgi:hypothetical protein
MGDCRRISTARGGIYYTIKHCAIVVPLLRQGLIESTSFLITYMKLDLEGWVHASRASWKDPSFFSRYRASKRILMSSCSAAFAKNS